MLDTHVRAAPAAQADESIALCAVDADEAFAHGLRLSACHEYLGAAECFQQALRGGAEIAPCAHYELGRLFEQGRGVAPDPARAVEHFTHAALHGHARAMYRLGLAYATGRGAWRDEVLAMNWLRLAAAHGLSGAQFQLGMLHLGAPGSRRAPAVALYWLRAAADAGLAAAQYQLGRLLEAGDGCGRDLAQAVARFRQAAEQGWWPAQFALARLYEYALRLWPEGRAALQSWRRKALDYAQGCSLAMLESP
ncbi:MAG: sel1 repeat family protein [Betaproteobacteria bacterium]|nr:sel1 repeat family protein [Betaproteobacteria bacterium]